MAPLTNVVNSHRFITGLPRVMVPIQLVRLKGWYVRFWSQADMCSAKGDVRFTPGSGPGRDIRYARFGSFADITTSRRHVRFTPKADIGFDHRAFTCGQ